MESDRSQFCGCKGIRTCLKCENHYNIVKSPLLLSKFQNVHTYCPDCGVTDPGSFSHHPDHLVDSVRFPGVYLKLDFISIEEEQSLMNALDALPWDPSQSGRRKQNFGPKCNFKKRRLQLGSFNGFPVSTKFIQDRFSETKILKDYTTIEQCSLEYNEANGASIDPHIDDCWIWGERIVTVNLLSDSVLTLMPYRGDSKRYNLELAPEGFRRLLAGNMDGEERVVRVPMPRRSLLVLFGEARYCWEHCVLREDISGRRVCLAYREFTPPYLPGGADQLKSKDILEQAHIYW